VRLASIRALAAALAALADVAAAQEQPPVRLPPVEVIGTTPLRGTGTPLNEVPGNVQSFTGRDVGRQRPADLADFLDGNANNVTVSSPSGNSFQNDVAFRGFTASALLGTPQGLSVFVDGVRVNEMFGDVVNWDLIPVSAIAGIQLIPGSNPVFGLNTLGGALAVTTRSGIDSPGASVEGSAGSFGRRTLGFSAGGVRDDIDVFVTGSLLNEDGWRDYSPSRIRQLFAKVGWRSADSDASLGVTLADNSLYGTQALPLSMLGNPRQAYTWPDGTHNKLAFVNLGANSRPSGASLVSSTLYYRGINSSGINSNVNADLDQPDSPPAFNVDSTIDAKGYGGALQLSLGDAAIRGNQLTLGIAADLGNASFRQSSQPATITAQRETVGYAPFVLITDADATTRQYGAYAMDTLHVTDAIAATVSMRYNYASIALSDRTGETPALNGTNTYRRLNPAAGATWNINDGSTLYANWSQGMRVPTPVELTCADPDAPCTLPNIFVADPPLLPVIGTTIEVGTRGASGTQDGVRGGWSAAAFRTDLRNDIQFVAAGSGAANSGYFRNVGRTRREGFELAASATYDSLSFVARYSYTRATFETAFVESSPNNSTASTEGTIVVNPGDRIPGIPTQLLKLRATWSPLPSLDIGAALIAASGQYARGDENNLDRNGPVPGYALVNLDLRYRFSPGWEVFASVNNVFDTRYQNFGILGVNFFRGPGNTYAPALAQSEQFRAPGAPLGAWVGVRYAFSDGPR
jgi:outer membrane receptor protein involved in Fe transport